MEDSGSAFYVGQHEKARGYAITEEVLNLAHQQHVRIFELVVKGGWY